MFLTKGDNGYWHVTLNISQFFCNPVSIHEELIPRRRAFSDEMRNLISGSRNDDDSSTGAGSGQGGINASHTNSAQSRLLEQCSYRRNAYNNRNQTLLHLHRNESMGHNVEMIEMDQSWMLSSDVGYCGGSSSGSSVETIFNNCDSLRSPKKTTPIREQNYEVMASFNHLRDTENTSNGNEPHMGEMHEACSICHGGKKAHGVDSDKEENEYVNLPPPKNSQKLKPHGLVDSEILSRGQMQSSEDRLEKTEKQTAKLSTNAAHARTMSLPLNEDYLLMKFNENGNSKPGLSRTGKGRSLSVHPSMERSDSLPPPFDDLVPASTLHSILQELPDQEKTSNECSKISDIPVPFHHGDLVKPVGPIAMLRLSSLSSSSNESVSSACDSLLDAKVTRGTSFSRPRQSSVGSSYQRAFIKKQSRSQDERSTSPLPSTISSRGSDPDFQSRMMSQRDPDDSEAFIYVRKGSVERRPESRRPESPISSAPSVTSYITRRRQSLQRADGSLGG